MKGFGILIVAVVMGFLGYQVAYPRIFDPSFFPKDDSGAASKTAAAKPAVIPEVAALKQAQPKDPAGPKQPPPETTAPSTVPSPATNVNGTA